MVSNDIYWFNVPRGTLLSSKDFTFAYVIFRHDIFHEHQKNLSEIQFRQICHSCEGRDSFSAKVALVPKYLIPA